MAPKRTIASSFTYFALGPLVAGGQGGPATRSPEPSSATSRFESGLSRGTVPREPWRLILCDLESVHRHPGS